MGGLCGTQTEGRIEQRTESKPIISKKDEWMSSLHEIFENNDKFD